MEEAKRQKALTTEITQEMEEDGEVIIDIKQKDLTIEITHLQMVEDEEINGDIKAMTEISEDGLLSPLCCIYMVPPNIRLLKKEAYTPNVVSIGPFHHGDVRLKDMERHKHIMFKRFVQEAKEDLDSLVNFAKQAEPEVRASYFESVNYGKRDLVKLMIVDAAFIVQLFIIFEGGNMFKAFQDAKLSKSWLREDIMDDLLLLENQLPFFFLEKLYDAAFPLNHRGDLPSFLELTCFFFQDFNKQDLKPGPNIKHFTDLLRLFYLPRTKPIRGRFQADDGSDILLYSANELKEAGVKLQGSKSKCLLDLKFLGSVLEIPQIFVHGGTETLFRNLIALEQCHYPYESYFVDYMFVMDSLVNTSKDVEVLSRNKIINNWLNDADDVATLFNGLGKNILHVNFNVEYLDICERLNNFHHNPCHMRKATLRRDYCKTPWQTVASIAGILLLILTLIQTIFSILQVVSKQ